MKAPRQPLSVPLVGMLIVFVLVALGMVVGIVVVGGKLVLWALGGEE